MAWKRLTLPTQLNPSLLERLAAPSPRPGKSGDVAANSNEDEMKNRDRNRRPAPPAERAAHLALAIARFRKWDAELIRAYGDLYYRVLRFPLH
mgnify:CR=1 FL=1